jgi:hypothetical protein
MTHTTLMNVQYIYKDTGGTLHCLGNCDLLTMVRSKPQRVGKCVAQNNRYLSTLLGKCNSSWLINYKSKIQKSAILKE